MIRPKYIIAACLSLSLGSFLQAQNVTGFAFEISGTGSNSGSSKISISYSASGNGTTLPLGPTNFSTTGTITVLSSQSGSAAGSVTCAFANGDSVSGTYTGPVLTLASGGTQTSGTATITGGTGQFQNASGSYTFVLITSDITKTSSTFTLSGSGSITTTNPIHVNYAVAHFPYGGGWSTRLLLANNSSSDATVNISFLNQSGQSTSVSLEDVGSETTQQLVVPANNTVAIGADLSQRNGPTVQVAWATVSSTAPLNIFSLFDYGPHPPAITGAVGAQSTAPSESFRFAISVGGPLSYDAGIALANPNGSPTSVTVKVYNADGSLYGSFPEALAAYHQIAFMLSQQLTFPSTLFTGSVAVCATQPVGLVANGVEGGSTGLFTIPVTYDPCP